MKEVLLVFRFPKVYSAMTDDMMTKDGTNPWTLLFETYPKMARMFKATLDEDREVCREIIKTLEDSGRKITAIIVTAQFGFVCPDILHHFKAAIIYVQKTSINYYTTSN